MSVQVHLHAPNEHTSDSSTAQDLRVQLQVLRAVRVHEEGAPGHNIVLVGWPMGQAVMEALAGLPAGAEALAGLPAGAKHSLTFKRCQWPLEETAYKQLAQYVPPAYTKWHLGSQLSVGQVASIIAGADLLRVSGEGVRRLGVTVSDGVVVREVQRRGYQNRHVELSEAVESDSESEYGSEYGSEESDEGEV